MEIETVPVGTLPPGSDFTMSMGSIDMYRVRQHCESYVKVTPHKPGPAQLLHEDDRVIPVNRRGWWSRD